MLTTMAITPTENLPHEPQCPPAYFHTTHKDTSFQVKGLEQLRLLQNKRKNHKVSSKRTLKVTVKVEQKWR